jgi:dTDP-4-dehydrorhamnose reductase
MRRGRPLLITGATGTLGRAFASGCALRGIAHVLTARSDLDIADEPSIQRALLDIQPWGIVNACGYVRVDDAESDERACMRENALGPHMLAVACAEAGLPLVSFSSDLVFDGEKRRPYVESDVPSPLSVYGRSKADAEQFVLGTHPGALVIRTSAFFGPDDEHNFIRIALREIAAGRPFYASPDHVVSPTYVPDLVNATLDLLLDGESGIWHLANEGAVSWSALARDAARLAGLPAHLVTHAAPTEMHWRAARPAYSVLGSERAAIMPPLEHALRAFMLETQQAAVV